MWCAVAAVGVQKHGIYVKMAAASASTPLHDGKYFCVDLMKAIFVIGIRFIDLPIQNCAQNIHGAYSI